MDITVRPAKDRDELAEFVPVHRRTYLMPPEDAEPWAGWVEPELFRIARRGDRMIGGAYLRRFAQFFGGRSVPTAGLSAVGVEPQERASGAGGAFMKAILEELHSDGIPLSTLYPATQKVYRNVGYELAGDHIRYRLDTDAIDVRDRTLKITHSTDRDAFKPIYEAAAKRSAGLLDRSDAIWERVFEPWPVGESDAYLVEGEQGPEGYIVYHREKSTTVRHFMYGNACALTGAAARRILTFLVDHKSFVEYFGWNGGPADPFNFALADPRRRVHLSWPWMMRIVEPIRALKERGYPQHVEAELHLRITDDILEANNLDLVLAVSAGKAEVATGGRGSFKVDVRGLAPLYSGYLSASELLSTGYLEADQKDQLAANSIFAGPAPWMPDFF